MAYSGGIGKERITGKRRDRNRGRQWPKRGQNQQKQAYETAGEPRNRSGIAGEYGVQMKQARRNPGGRLGGRTPILPSVDKGRYAFGAAQTVADCVIVLAGRQARACPLPCQHRSGHAEKSCGVFRVRKWRPARLTKKLGWRPAMRKTKLAVISAPKNRVCPCQLMVSKIHKLRSFRDRSGRIRPGKAERYASAGF